MALNKEQTTALGGVVALSAIASTGVGPMDAALAAIGFGIHAALANPDAARTFAEGLDSTFERAYGKTISRDLDPAGFIENLGKDYDGAEG